MARGRLHMGTSGFAYKEWVGPFYPSGTKAAGMLGAYAERFPSVEINYTFRRRPSASTLETWAAATPESFTFACKAPMGITHFGRLAGIAAERLAEFLEVMAPLGERLGPILVQCPPNLRYDPAVLDGFLALLAGRPQRFAMEFRHPSFDADEVPDKLAAAGVAWCVADSDDREGRFLRTAPDFAYVRLRREAYDPPALTRWAKPIKAALDAGADVYCYRKHEGKDTGPDDALALQDLVARSRKRAPSRR
ncbi:MAG: DUF72 domain-containing protein [Acidimicrobiia bacterium]